MISKDRDENKESMNFELVSYLTSVGSLLNLNTESFLLSHVDESVLVQQLFKPPQIFTFQTSDNLKLYGMIYMPYNFEHGAKYPTLLYVYGGPRAQLVTNAYKANK